MKAVDFTRPKTAQAAVLDALRQMIVMGELPPGAVVRQEVIAQQFGVSRVPVREALRILEGEGKVQHMAHQGYRVPRLGIDELLEVYRLRDLLETEAATKAVPLLQDEHLQRMREAMKAMDRAADSEDLVAVGVANRAFHFAILGAAGLSVTMRFLIQLWETTDPYRRLYFTRPVTRDNVNAEHELIYQACEARNVDRVVSLLQQHRQHAVDDLKALEEPW